MKSFVLFALILGSVGAEAQARGHRGLFARGCHRRTTSLPVPCPPTWTPTPQAWAPAPLAVTQPPPVTPAPAQSPVAPVASGPAAWEYTADGRETPAYFVTLDESGKPIPVQWMDWLFRGGKDAGMPRPPLPIIGRITRN